MVRDLALSVATNPLILASVLGIVFGASALTLPGAVDGTLAFVGQAGPPAGLFALGATLGQRRIGGRSGPVGAMMLMKLALHPLLAWLTAFHLFGLDPLAASVALLFAACPVGANVYVFAAHYGAATEISATAILLSTFAALISLSGLAVLLSLGTI
jgi:predicted permease